MCFSVIHFAKHAEIPTVSTSTGLANDITKEGVSPPAAIPPHMYGWPTPLPRWNSHPYDQCLKTIGFP